MNSASLFSMLHQKRRWLVWALVTAALFMGVSACSTTTVQQRTKPPYSEKYSRTTALFSVMFRGQAMPEGVNNWACRPDSGRSHLVLLHGTFSSTMLSFGALAPRLANAGYCVYSLDYGARDESDWFKAVKPVRESAAQVAAFLDNVLVQTGAKKIDLIGHSQGGLLGFYVIKELGYGNRINHFLAMAPSVGGTEIASAANHREQVYCAACADQHPQSEVIQTLQKGRVSQPGVRYTVLVTEDDYIVRPVENQFVREPGVRNLYIQDRLPGKFATHSNMLYDDEVLDLVLELLSAQQ